MLMTTCFILRRMTEEEEEEEEEEDSMAKLEHSEGCHTQDGLSQGKGY